MTAADELVAAMLPLLLFMLIPLWIPLIAVLGGAFADRLAAGRASRVSRATN